MKLHEDHKVISILAINYKLICIKITIGKTYILNIILSLNLRQDFKGSKFAL